MNKKSEINQSPIRNPQSPLISSKSEHGDKSPLYVVLPPSLFSKENRGDEGENKGGQSAICNGFTLMELLVVIAIMGMLSGILLPTLNVGRERARRAVCAGNLKVIGEAFHMYNIDHGQMPPTPIVGTIKEATNQIKTNAPAIIGLGYFHEGDSGDTYIEDFAAYVCPSSDKYRNPKEIKQNWEASGPAVDTFSAYIYRAESGGSELMLSDAKPAIVMDYDCSDSSLGQINYNHKEEYVNILFRNGYVKGVENIYDAVSGPATDKILTLETLSTAEKNRVFLNADKQQ